MEIISEAKRFFRYFLPGAVILLQNGIVWTIYLLLNTKNTFKDIISDFGSISAIVSTIVGAGVLGFLISLIYHGLFWGTSLRSFYMVDYRKLINELIKQEKIIINPPLFGEQRISQMAAWRIATSLWFSRSKDDRIKRTVQRTTDLSDIVGGLGTIFVGSVISYLVFFLSLFCFCAHNDVVGFTHTLIFWLVFIYFIHKNFVITINNTKGVVDIGLYDVLKEESSPVEILLTSNYDIEYSKNL